MSYHEGLLGRSPGVSRFAQIGNTRIHRIIRVIDHNFPEQIIERAHKIQIPRLRGHYSNNTSNWDFNQPTTKIIISSTGVPLIRYLEDYEVGAVVPMKKFLVN